MAHDTTGHGRDGEQGHGPVLLVAYDGNPMSEAQLHLACRAANDIGGLVRVLYVAELPRHLPLDVPLPASEQQRVVAAISEKRIEARRYSTEEGLRAEMRVVRE